MLTAADIRDRVRLRLFRPLRIVTSSGETYDVYHGWHPRGYGRLT